MKAPAQLGVTAAILFVGGGLLITHGSVTASRSVANLTVSLAASDAATPQHHADPPDDGAVVDLYGNEVTDAIATYSIDPAGSVYELHSPQTEVPRLGSPKS